MNTERQIKLVGYCLLVCHDIWWHILTNHDISWQIMTFCHKNQKLHFVAETRNYGIFVARINYYVLIDSFWGCAGFIDSPTSSATLPLCMPQLQWTLSQRTLLTYLKIYRQAVEPLWHGGPDNHVGVGWSSRWLSLIFFYYSMVRKHVDQVAMEVMNVKVDEMGNKVKDFDLFLPGYIFLFRFFYTWPLDSRNYIAFMKSIPYSLRMCRHFIFKVVLL